MLKRLMYTFMKEGNIMNEENTVPEDVREEDLCICGELLTQDHYEHMAKGH